MARRRITAITHALLPFANVLVDPRAVSACTGPQNVDELASALYGPGSGYAKLTRPSVALLAGTGTLLENAPADVYYFQLQFNQVLSVDTRLQHFTVDVWTREVWSDWRLRYNTSNYSCFRNWTADLRPGQDPYVWTVIPSTEVDNLWVPHANLLTLLEAEVLHFQAWLVSDGRVWLTKRQILKFSCSMDFAFMPFDVQLCHVPVQVLSYHPSEVILVPGVNDGIPMKVTPRGGVFVGGPVDWTLDQNRFSGKIVCEYIGNYYEVCDVFLKLTFAFERDPSYYIRNVLAIVILCVLVSWTSFFISRTAAPARVTLTIISFLTMSTRMNSVMETLPNLSGSVWLLDIILWSLYFSMYAALEYVACNFLLRLEARIQYHWKEVQKIASDSVRSAPAEDCGKAVASKDTFTADIDVDEALYDDAGAPPAQTHLAGSHKNGHRRRPQFIPRYLRERTFHDAEGDQEQYNELRTIMQGRLHRCDRLFHRGLHGMLITATNLDVFSRYAFICCYVLVLMVYCFILPATNSSG